jgi:two-component system, sensor histidine kinase and response regulator
MRRSGGRPHSGPTPLEAAWAGMDTPIARILIVDDEAAQALALARTLQIEGYATTPVTQAMEALPVLRAASASPQTAFDVLITDLMMPELDGIALLRSAMQLDEHLAVIVMTGHGTIDSAVAAMKNGALDYIEKPFNLTAIMPVLSRALAVRRLRRDNAALVARVAERTLELEAANSELRSVNRELEAFAHAVAHDLRTPLHVMIGFAELLAGETPGPLTALQKEYLTDIHASGIRLMHLTKHLLDLALLGRDRLMREVLNVSEMVGEVVAELRRSSSDRQVTVRTGALPEASADRTLIRQVFINLLSNAFKFTNGLTDARIEVEGWREDNATVYSVRDNGAGFDMRQARSLFAPFRRLHSADQFPGTGVGLSLVRRIVERHGGQVTAAGEVGKGACFRISLPG